MKRIIILIILVSISTFSKEYFNMENKTATTEFSNYVTKILQEDKNTIFQKNIVMNEKVEINTGKTIKFNNILDILSVLALNSEEPNLLLNSNNFVILSTNMKKSISEHDVFRWREVEIEDAPEEGLVWACIDNSERIDELIKSGVLAESEYEKYAMMLIVPINNPEKFLEYGTYFILQDDSAATVIVPLDQCFEPLSKPLDNSKIQSLPNI